MPAETVKGYAHSLIRTQASIIAAKYARLWMETLASARRHRYSSTGGRREQAEGREVDHRPSPCDP